MDQLFSGKGKRQQRQRRLAGQQWERRPHWHQKKSRKKQLLYHKGKGKLQSERVIRKPRRTCLSLNLETKRSGNGIGIGECAAVVGLSACVDAMADIHHRARQTPFSVTSV
jgi:hypothetical protein